MASVVSLRWKVRCGFPHLWGISGTVSARRGIARQTICDFISSSYFGSALERWRLQSTPRSPPTTRSYRPLFIYERLSGKRWHLGFCFNLIN